MKFSNSILKYFGDHCVCVSTRHPGEDCLNKMAMRVLRSMEEPINVGDRYLMQIYKGHNDQEW